MQIILTDKEAGLGGTREDEHGAEKTERKRRKTRK
jgi:hypothetical protein